MWARRCVSAARRTEIRTRVRPHWILATSRPLVGRLSRRTDCRPHWNRLETNTGPVWMRMRLAFRCRPSSDWPSSSASLFSPVRRTETRTSRWTPIDSASVCTALAVPEWRCPFDRVCCPSIWPTSIGRVENVVLGSSIVVICLVHFGCWWISIHLFDYIIQHAAERRGGGLELDQSTNLRHY